MHPWRVAAGNLGDSRGQSQRALALSQILLFKTRYVYGSCCVFCFFSEICLQDDGFNDWDIIADYVFKVSPLFVPLLGG